MKDFVILADVTCEVSEEMRAEFGIADYVSGHITVNGEDYATQLNFGAFTRESFYKLVSDPKSKIATSPASPEEFKEYFTKYVKEGKAVLSMALSSKISGTHGFASTAAAAVKEEYPDAEIYCFDAFRMSGGYGLLVAYAYQMKNEGKTMEEIIAWLEENKTKVHQMGPIDDLIFVARRGRLTMGKAIMGSFAGVKPMGDCNAEGYTSVLTKAKGIKKAFDLTVKYIKETAVNPEEQIMVISHSDRELYANTLKEMVEKELNPKKVYVCDIYPASGANIGPGMIGVYYLGNPIAEDMAAEKAAMNKVLGK